MSLQYEYSHDPGGEFVLSDLSLMHLLYLKVVHPLEEFLKLMAGHAKKLTVI